MTATTADTPQVLLEHHLKALRLPTMLREYEKLARTCAVEKADFPHYLLRPSPELELLDRDRRSTERRIRQARFPVVKSLDSFDFLAIPALNKTLVLRTGALEFLTRKENILLLGNSGTGKTHIALALGLAACQRGHRVRFLTAADAGRRTDRGIETRSSFGAFQKQLAAHELLIIDELGYVPLSKTGADVTSSRPSASARARLDTHHQQPALQRSGQRYFCSERSPVRCSIASLTTSWSSR